MIQCWGINCQTRAKAIELVIENRIRTMIVRCIATSECSALDSDSERKKNDGDADDADVKRSESGKGKRELLTYR